MIGHVDELPTSTLTSSPPLAGTAPSGLRLRFSLAAPPWGGADLFITNDRRFSRKAVPGLHFIQSLATAVL